MTWTQGLASLEKTLKIVFEDLDLKTAIPPAPVQHFQEGWEVE